MRCATLFQGMCVEIFKLRIVLSGEMKNESDVLVASGVPEMWSELMGVQEYQYTQDRAR